MSRSRFSGSPSLGLQAARLQSSLATFDACVLQDLEMAGGSIKLSGCVVGGPYLFGPVVAPIVMNGGELRFVGGELIGNSIGQGILGTGQVRIDPATSIVTGQAVHGAGTQRIEVGMPWTTTSAVAGGQAIATQLLGPPGEFGVVVVGLCALPQIFPGLDPWWIDANASFVQAFGVLGGAAPVGAGTAIPTAPGISGLSLVWQGLLFDGSSGLHASNPAWFILP